MSMVIKPCWSNRLSFSFSRCTLVMHPGESTLGRAPLWKPCSMAMEHGHGPLLEDLAMNIYIMISIVFHSHGSLPKGMCPIHPDLALTWLSCRLPPRNNDPVVRPIDRSFRLLWHGVVDESVLFVDPRLANNANRGRNRSHGESEQNLWEIYVNLWWLYWNVRVLECRLDQEIPSFVMEDSLNMNQ